MAIKNVTRKALLASSSRVADSAVSRAIGLMFSKATKGAMILRFSRDTKVSLHTFFVFFPIDILLVSSSNRIVEMKEAMQPFTTFTASKKARYVVELPAGTIPSTKTRVADEVAFFHVRKEKLENGRRITVSRAQKPA